MPSPSPRFGFLSDADVLNHSRPRTVSATHFLICIRVPWKEIHHGENKADGRDTAGFAVHPLPTRPGNHFTSCHRPRLSPALLFINVGRVCAVGRPSVFRRTGPNCTWVFITIDGRWLWALVLHLLSCCLLIKPVSLWHGHLWDNCLDTDECFLFLHVQAASDHAPPQTSLRLIGSMCLSGVSKVGELRRTGIHMCDTNFKFHPSHRLVDLQQVEQLIYTEGI